MALPSLQLLDVAYSKPLKETGLSLAVEGPRERTAGCAAPAGWEFSGTAMIPQFLNWRGGRCQNTSSCTTLEAPHTGFV